MFLDISEAKLYSFAIFQVLFEAEAILLIADFSVGGHSIFSKNKLAI